MTGLRNFVFVLASPFTFSKFILKTEEVMLYPLGATGISLPSAGAYTMYPVPVGADPGISIVTFPLADVTEESIPEAYALMEPPSAAATGGSASSGARPPIGVGRGVLVGAGVGRVDWFTGAAQTVVYREAKAKMTPISTNPYKNTFAPLEIDIRPSEITLNGYA